VDGFFLPFDNAFPNTLASINKKPKGGIRMPATADEHHSTGSLGSDFWQLKVPPELVSVLAREFDWNRLGRRVVIDAREGIIAWMNPSSTHEILGKATDLTVRMAGAVMNRQVREMGGTRWKGPNDPEQGGLEPDEAFYLGDKAAAWYEADRKGGEEAVLEFEARNPPDLVVEVEVTHHDIDKPHRYSELGVREMWRVDGQKGIKHLKVEILDLLGGNQPRAVPASQVLEGLAAADLPSAFLLARRNNIKGLGDLLKVKLAPASTPDPEDDSESTKSSFITGM